MGLLTRLRSMFGRGPKPASKECMRVGAVLQQYLDQELDTEQTLAVLAHLDECRDCGLEADTYRRLKSALQRAGEPDPAAVDRLREFADRLVAGEADGHDHASSD